MPCSTRRAPPTWSVHSQVLWVENTLSCTTWTYYCDIKRAMARLHDLCQPSHEDACSIEEGRRGKRWIPDLAVIGPKCARAPPPTRNDSRRP